MCVPRMFKGCRLTLGVPKVRAARHAADLFLQSAVLQGQLQDAQEHSCASQADYCGTRVRIIPYSTWRR